ncbi:MAG: hypothetical protein WEB52_05875 [Dehalococcoidia bacterium]
MNKGDTYGQGRGLDKARLAKDTETMVGNSVATILAVVAGIVAVIGLLTGFDAINVENPFESGLLWLATAIVAGLCANVFRREHHILDEDEVRRGEVGSRR